MSWRRPNGKLGKLGKEVYVGPFVGMVFRRWPNSPFAGRACCSRLHRRRGLLDARVRTALNSSATRLCPCLLSVRGPLTHLAGYCRIILFAGITNRPFLFFFFLCWANGRRGGKLILITSVRLIFFNSAASAIRRKSGPSTSLKWFLDLVCLIG